MIDLVERAGNQLAVLAIGDLELLGSVDVVEGERLSFGCECVGAAPEWRDASHAGESAEQNLRRLTGIQTISPLASNDACADGIEDAALRLTTSTIDLQHEPAGEKRPVTRSLRREGRDCDQPSVKKRSASSAAMQPEPADVTAWR